MRELSAWMGSSSRAPSHSETFDQSSARMGSAARATPHFPELTSASIFELFELARRELFRTFRGHITTSIVAKAARTSRRTLFSSNTAPKSGSSWLIALACSSSVKFVTGIESSETVITHGRE